jgi:periplasmic protein TonB
VLTRLPESNARRQRRTGGFVVSTVVHLAVIALAVRASGLTAAPSPREQPPNVIYDAFPEPRKPDAPRPPTSNRDLADPSTSVHIPELPAPVSTDIPTTLPELGAMQGLIERAFDEPRLSMAGQPNGSPNVSDGSPLPEHMVEKPVVAIPGTATPRYPGILQSAGVEGSVRAQFVVDTLGRVEQGSFRALESTHDLFTAAVRDALTRARFKPAEVGGHRVRQLVEQSFAFSIATRN